LACVYVACSVRLLETLCDPTAWKELYQVFPLFMAPFSVMSENSGYGRVKLDPERGSGVVIARTGESGDAYEWIGDLPGRAVAELAIAAALNVALRIPRG